MPTPFRSDVLDPKSPIGISLLLVLLPTVVLISGLSKEGKDLVVWLPMMAIFGIMILFGAMSLVSALFARLELADKTQPLALPEGSIRATIALALIVLFAIIAITLYVSSLNAPKPFALQGLTFDSKESLIKQHGRQVVAVIQEPCPQATCAENDNRYTMYIQPTTSPESADIAKQLLILVGTLMTSVTSFYFGSRGAISAATDPAKPATAAPMPTPVSPLAPLTPPAPEPGAHGDACDHPIAPEQFTKDEHLPPATGGVAP